MGGRHGLEIRAANAADAPGLADLMRSAGWTADSRALSERIEALRSAGGAALLALEWGPPSGVVALHWRRTLDADRPTAQITTLFVGPDHRRRGIGRLLLKAAAQAARAAGCDMLSLSAGPGDAELRAFCAATGFAEVGAWLARPLRKRS